MFVGSLIGTSLNYYEAKDCIIAVAENEAIPKNAKPVRSLHGLAIRLEHKLMIVATSIHHHKSVILGVKFLGWTLALCHWKGMAVAL